MTLSGLVARQLRAKPLRAALTVLAFAVSVGLLGFLLVLADALKQDWSPYMGQRAMVVAKTSFFDRLPMAYLARIEAVPGIQRVSPFDFVIGFKGDNRAENQIPISAADGEALLEIYREAKITKEEAKAWLEDPTGCVVGQVLVNKFGWKVGDRLVLKAPVTKGVVEATVRGVFRYKPENSVYLHRRYFEELTGNQGKAAMFWILAKSRDDVAKVTAAIEKDLENSPVPIRAMSEKQWQLQFMQMLGNVKLLISSIGLATAFTLLFITANTIAMNARERRGETALLRVLGFQRGTVAGMLLLESLAIGVLGAILGTLLIVVFGKVVGTLLDQTQLAGISGLLVVTPQAIGTAVATSGFLAVAAAIVPALGLTRRSIVSLLREPR